MNKKIFLPFISLAIVAGIIIVSSCQKDAKAVEPKKDYSFVQDFDSVEGVLNQGWVSKNNSRPLGTTTWNSGEYHWLNDPKKGISPVGSYPGYNTSHSGRDYFVCLNTCQADPAVAGQGPLITQPVLLTGWSYVSIPVTAVLKLEMIVLQWVTLL